MIPCFVGACRAFAQASTWPFLSIGGPFKKGSGFLERGLGLGLI